MRNLKTIGFAMVLLLGSAAGSGCNNPDKARIAGLEREKQGLETRVRDLQVELNALQSGQGDAGRQLAEKDALLKAREAELAAMRSQAAPVAVANAAPTAQGWEKGPHGDKVTVGTDVMFSPGSANLTAEGKKKLDKIAADIKSNYGKLPVRVFGHTDDDPIKKSAKLWQDNLDLSANRAMAVTRYLVSKGIRTSAVETVGMGAWHPDGDNKSSASKAKNRRVEIVVVKD